MGPVTFKRLTPQESRIYVDGDHVGDVYCQNDILVPDRVFYVVHLHEDPRGPQPVRDRRRIREVAQFFVDTYPLWS